MTTTGDFPIYQCSYRLIFTWLGAGLVKCGFDIWRPWGYD